METLFRRQHGVATWAQLLAAGLTAREVRSWIAAGHLRRVHRGVYAVGWLPLSEPARFMAAVLASGELATVSHHAAGVLHHFLERALGSVDITVPTWRRRREGIALHVSATAETTLRLGIRTTTAERTLLDLAATNLPDRHLRRALHEAEVQGATTHDRAADLLASHEGARGAPRLRRLLAPGPRPTRSELEDRLLELVHDLPHHETNALVRGYEVDLLFPDRRVIVEADGRRFHDTPEARRRDAERQAELEAAGYRVLRITWQDVTGAPQRTRARVLRALA